MSALDKRVAKAEAATTAGYTVRPMELDDVERVALLHVEVWRSAYAALLPERFLASLDVRELADQWSDRLSTTSAQVSHLVGLRPDGRIAALGSAGPTRDPGAPAAHEIHAINVVAEERGSGLADLMMQRLVAGQRCSLWVLEGNERAIAFYESYGFQMDDFAKQHPATGAAELRMVRG